MSMSLPGSVLHTACAEVINVCNIDLHGKENQDGFCTQLFLQHGQHFPTRCYILTNASLVKTLAVGNISWTTAPQSSDNDDDELSVTIVLENVTGKSLDDSNNICSQYINVYRAAMCESVLTFVTNVTPLGFSRW